MPFNLQPPGSSSRPSHDPDTKQPLYSLCEQWNGDSVRWVGIVAHRKRSKTHDTACIGLAWVVSSSEDMFQQCVGGSWQCRRTAYQRVTPRPLMLAFFIDILSCVSVILNGVRIRIQNQRRTFVCLLSIQVVVDITKHRDMLHMARWALNTDLMHH